MAVKTLASELKRLREEKSAQLGRTLGRNEVAAEAGIGAATLGMLENGDRGNPSSETLFKLCSFFGVPVEVLADVLVPGVKVRHGAPGGGDTQVVPFGGYVAAGQPIDPETDGHNTIEVPGRYPTKVMAFRVRGNSMTAAAILDGDCIVVRMQPDADVGEIVVALVDGGITLKVMELQPRRDKAKKEKVLMPKCDDAKPIWLSADQRPEIIGVLIAVYRKLGPKANRSKPRK